MCPQISVGEMSVFKGGTGSQDRVERRDGIIRPRREEGRDHKTA